MVSAFDKEIAIRGKARIKSQTQAEEKVSKYMTILSSKDSDSNPSFIPRTNSEGTFSPNNAEKNQSSRNEAEQG